MVQLPSWFKVGLNFSTLNISNNLYCIIDAINIEKNTCDVTVVNYTHKFSETNWNLEHTLWAFELNEYYVVRDCNHNILYFRPFCEGDYVRTSFGVGIVVEDEHPIKNEKDICASIVKIKSKFQKHNENIEVPRAYLYRISKHEYEVYEKSNQKNTIIHQSK